MNEVVQAITPYLNKIVSPIKLEISLDSTELSNKIKEFCELLAERCENITVQHTEHKRVPSIKIVGEKSDGNYFFYGVPHGHETTPFLLALLNMGGHPQKITDSIKKRIENLSFAGTVNVYSSPSCHNCPTVAEAFGLITSINSNIETNVIDGTSFRDEINELGIMSVPTVYVNGTRWSVGKMELNDILSKLEEEFGTNHELSGDRKFKNTDIAIIGSGPAGVGACVYAARKGLDVTLIGDNIGGQMNDTNGIENYIGLKSTTGEELTSMMAEHVNDYQINHLSGVLVEKILPHAGENNLHVLQMNNGEDIHAKAVIIATGADWNKLGVKNEDDLIGAGVSFCPHCDGPMFKNKVVGVVGGGNSGVEAAIDLSGIASKVHLFVRGDELTADKVLHSVVENKNNVEIHWETSITKFNKKDDGSLSSVTAEGMLDDIEIDLDGCFIQIGLSPKTEFIKGSGIEMNRWNEVIVNKDQETNVERIYAAGDCTDTTYKQIIIATGQGTVAALRAFDKLMVF